MTSDQLNDYIGSKIKPGNKFIVLAFIYGFNEDGKPTFTIDDIRIRSFKSAKKTKKSNGFADYMMGLKFDMLGKFPNFSVVAFVKIKDEFFPCYEMGVNSQVQSRKKDGI